jgi:hypothetical protein
MHKVFWPAINAMDLPTLGSHLARCIGTAFEQLPPIDAFRGAGPEDLNQEIIRALCSLSIFNAKQIQGTVASESNS